MSMELQIDENTLVDLAIAPVNGEVDQPHTEVLEDALWQRIADGGMQSVITEERRQKDVKWTSTADYNQLYFTAKGKEIDLDHLAWGRECGNRRQLLEDHVDNIMESMKIRPPPTGAIESCSMRECCGQETIPFGQTTRAILKYREQRLADGLSLEH